MPQRQCVYDVVTNIITATLRNSPGADNHATANLNNTFEIPFFSISKETEIAKEVMARDPLPVAMFFFCLHV